MTGIILLDKPKNITSFGAIAAVRRITGEKKCGHTGTLDPMATGVMTVMLGGATRFCELLPCHDKTYIASFKLGITTDTLDITGEILSRSAFDVTAERVETVIKSFEGEIFQLPPMYSAVSVNGRRLYDIARKGLVIERERRRAFVYCVKMLDANEKDGEYTIEVECSCGTYIRAIVSDIGEALGCGAVLTDLRRIKANGFCIENCLTEDELKAAAENGRLKDIIIPVDKALSDLPEVTVTQAQAKRFSNGGELFLQRLNCPKAIGFYRVYSPEHQFIGLGEVDGSEFLKVKRVYNSQEV